MTHDYRHLPEVGEHVIPVASSVGSVDGASQLFDRSFRPVGERARARLGSILVATRQGEPLPPIEVYAWHGQYYVLDGHHQVAAARAVGSHFINAHVIEVLRGLDGALTLTIGAAGGRSAFGGPGEALGLPSV